MKKRALTILLALVLILGALPVQALAVRPDPLEETAAIVPNLDNPEGDELFAGYVQRTFYPSEREERDNAAIGNSAFSGADLKLYNLLKAEIIKVANGQLGSSVFNFNTTGMGIKRAPGELVGVNVKKIMSVLLLDLAYELYWYDKTEGYSYNWNYNTSTNLVTSIEFKLYVSQDYAVDVPGENKYYVYKPDTAKTGAATAAARNAQAIVLYHSWKSDYEKLVAYRDYISDQNTYNDWAAENDDCPYGDPWQMIYVFDNDPNTNVVCEGYSKAFKYLCDQSTFHNDIACYIARGFTSGAHMWNIVRINGQSYLADITNADTDRDNVRPLDAFFLVGAPNGTANGYTIHIPRYDVGGGRYVAAHDLTYTYRDEMSTIYHPAILTLARTNYVPTVDPVTPPTPPEPSAPVFTDLAPNAFYLDAVQWAVANKITTGKTTTTFEPGTVCNHGEILTFLWRAAGKPASNAEPPIPMNGNEFYYDALKWAHELNVVGSSFDPSTPCTRLYAVFYIWEAFGEPEPSIANPFTDITDGTLGTQSVLWALENGVTTGTTDTTFSPYQNCTRGQIVTFLHRAYQ